MGQHLVQFELDLGFFQPLISLPEIVCDAHVSRCPCRSPPGSAVLLLLVSSGLVLWMLQRNLLLLDLASHILWPLGVIAFAMIHFDASNPELQSWIVQ